MPEDNLPIAMNVTGNEYIPVIKNGVAFKLPISVIMRQACYNFSENINTSILISCKQASSAVVAMNSTLQKAQLFHTNLVAAVNSAKAIISCSDIGTLASQDANDVDIKSGKIGGVSVANLVAPILNPAAAAPEAKDSIFTLGFESSEITVSSGISTYNIPHNLGDIPKICQVFIRCKINDAGYSVGDEVYLCRFTNDGTHVFGYGANSSQCFAQQYNPPAVMKKDSSGVIAIIPANWKLVFRAYC